jgi:hypothetical protein
MKLQLARVIQRKCTDSLSTTFRYTEKACAGDSAPFVPQDKQKECGFCKWRRFVSLKRKNVKASHPSQTREGRGTRKI